MAKAKYEEIDLISCSYKEFRTRFQTLGLESFDGENVERIESLDDEIVKEFLKLSNGLDMDQNDAATKLLLPLRPLSFVLNGDGIEDRDTKLAYMVRNNLLQDKMILQRDNDQFYGFLPKGHRGLTLLEHAIIKHHFELANAIGDRLSEIDQSKLSTRENEILASQIMLYDYYKDSIIRRVKIPELDVFPRTYTYRNALVQGSLKLQKALIAAAMPFNLKTIQNFINDQYNKTQPDKYIQAVNPYDYLLSDDAVELIEIFDNTLLSPSDIAHITDNKILASLRKPTILKSDQEELDWIRLEYLSCIDPMRLYIEMSSIKDVKTINIYMNNLISTANNTDRLDIMDIVFYEILMGGMKILDPSVVNELFLCCAGWTIRSPEILAKYTACLRGEIDGIQYGQETLKSSALKFQLDILEYLITNYEIPIDTTTYDHRTALMNAAARGNKDVVEYLLGKGAELNMLDHQHRSALMHAVMNDKRDVAEYLVTQGANYFSEDNMGRTILMYAAANGNYDFVESVILFGAHIDDVDDDRMTALMYAVQGCHLRVAEYLVAKGANVNAKDGQDKSVLMYAAQEGSKDLVEYLVTQGASISDVNKKSKTPLMYAAENGKKDIFDYLVSLSMDINVKDTHSKTLLMYAAKGGNKDIVEYLIAHAADINAKDKKSKTALMYGAQYGQVAIVKLLIKNGAKIDTRDESGDTALKYGIVWGGNIELVDLLVSAGAKLDIKDRCGFTALDYIIVFKNFSDRRNEISLLLKAGAYFDFNKHRNAPLALKELAMKYEREKKDYVLQNLREVKEGKASFDRLNSEDLLAIKNRLLSNIQKLGLSKFEELVNDEISDKALLLSILGLDVSAFDQAQINKLVKTAIKIIDKGMKEDIDPELVVNKLSEQLAIKAEMIKIRSANTEVKEQVEGFAAKVSIQQPGAGKSM